MEKGPNLEESMEESPSILPIMSSSKGNSFLVHSEGSAILIDAGVSARRLLYALDLIHIPVDRLKAVFISHEHGDHTSGIRSISKRFGVPFFSNHLTWEAISSSFDGRPPLEPNIFTNGETLSIPPFSITPFPLPHDAADPCGFLVMDKETSLGFALDLGFATTLVKEYLRGVNILVIEANHDPEMLLHGPYSWKLKKRIMGRHGHLSNQGAGRLILELLHPGLKRVILAHLSETNNSPESALKTVLDEVGPLPRGSIEFQVAEGLTRPAGVMGGRS